MTNRGNTEGKKIPAGQAGINLEQSNFRGNTVNAIIQAFQDSMRQSGIALDSEIIADGLLHRAHIVGQKSGSVNCAYVLHLDNRPAGYWQDMSNPGSKQTWRYQGEISGQTKVKPSMLRMHRQKKIDDLAQQQHDAALKAQRTWEAAKSAPATHPYLVKKDIKPHGLRVLNGDLVVPLINADLRLSSLQFIRPDGQKRFLAGGKKQGNFYAIEDGSKSTVSPLVIAEGFATAASVHEYTGYTVLVAFDSGNLIHVARAIQWAAVGRKIIIAGDNDESGVGQAAARAAAEAVGAQVIIPRLPGDWCDWKESIRGAL
ncbi:toprim domain-containing protein [Nitrosomonas mobilis]|uniref:Toprim protein n=1 Tax=Nitrosomonas mobilis TaxID=51642 RepID=A0A1G5SD75_9PROT